MKRLTVNNIAEFDVNSIVFDIDGTLKDLVLEHKIALKNVINKYVTGKKCRKKIVLWLDKLAMWFVKVGVLPTNGRMQKILITIYAIILARKADDFYELYKFFYEKETILFEDIEYLLEQLSKIKDVYFVTINKQNYNLESHVIKQDRMIYTTSQKKKKAYKILFKEKCLAKATTLIIGDNLFDDICVAKRMGVRSLLVNNYNSKFKDLIAKILNVGI